MLEKEADPLAQLEHIDMLQRLGISYHFENEIKSILNEIHSHRFNSLICEKSNLYATALQFRLLRQHGHCVAPGVLNAFKDDTGNFKACVRNDVMGMLSLYEASFHLLEVTHALELPLHWRLLRSEARWFIDVYEKRPHFNPAMLELAKLDFNVVQSTHQEDLKYASMWWKNSCLGEESLKFVRDRLLLHFLWTVGKVFEPQFGYCRRMLTEVNSLVTLIDDIYDVYGTLDELELFTDAVKRWDMNAKDQLPDYMKTCFLVLHDSINRTAFDVLKEQGFYVLKYLKNAWADLCGSYLVEAKWYHNGYKPTMQEYIENAWVSIAAPDEMKRGDVPKSIQCYMEEEGVSEDEGRKHIEFLINETWKQLNKDRLTNSPFSKTFVEIATNLARVAQFMYQHGDGHGVQDHETKDRVLFLLVNPVPLPPIRHEP
ncbi:hypothetical protein TIFTF001_010183 [Ficus carica]|uniref:Uncharacterized protein n=1 Tax=Ficus carica TaxID=3494 RepID=A0AA87ZWL9_FICCA|nr:hypothetical protein TIFTF001_010183 [Ficus carica]